MLTGKETEQDNQMTKTEKARMLAQTLAFSLFLFLNSKMEKI